MSRITRPKPSPALVVAVVALVAALAGTAVGGVAVTSLNKGDREVVKRIAKRQGKRQAKEQIKKKEPKLNVASARTARPYAYAEINGGAVSGDVPSRNITTADVSNPTSGVYCFELSFDPVTGAATSESENGSDDFAMLRLAPAPLQGCPETAEAEVRNYDVSSGQANDVVYVQFDW